MRFAEPEGHWGQREIITVILEPTGPESVRVDILTGNAMDADEVGRSLITVGEMVLAGGEPGVTSTGIIIGRIPTRDT